MVKILPLSVCCLVTIFPCTSWQNTFWEHFPESGKLTKQIFTSLMHPLISPQQIVNHRTDSVGYDYVPTYFLQNDPLNNLGINLDNFPPSERPRR